MISKKQITQLSYEITGLAIKVHKCLGPGLLESVYEECLKHELLKKGYKVQQQKLVPVYYDGQLLETRLKLDLMVNNLIIIELKTVEYLLPVHEAQLMTYMKLSGVPQGLLINFYTDNITKSMRPLVNDFFRELPDE